MHANSPMLGMSGARAVDRCDQLGGGRFSESAEHLFRPYLSRAHRAAVDQVADWMKDAGMTSRIDPSGSLIGRFEGSVAGAPALLIGSHLDSVRDAGRYDGPLGVMLGIECVDALRRQSRTLPFAIEVAAFGDEEGSRFPSAMLCSRAMAGLIDESSLEIDGLADALAEWRLDRRDFLAARRDPTEFVGYLEAHIEQGPVLESENLALGIVTAIAAQRRYEVTLRGIAGHAGTNSMGLRKDALTAAAEAILTIENIARAGAADLVATVGKIEALPGVANVVPGEARFSIDVRAGTVLVRDHAADEIVGRVSAIAAERGIACTITCLHDLAPSPCAAPMMRRLEQAVTAIGQPVRKLVSGAGHDAMALAALTPMAMLFLRCKDGISHNPAESVLAGDAELALSALLAFVEILTEDLHA
jgi:allantoate deiminase